MAAFADDNEVTLLDDHGATRLPRRSKLAIARLIVEELGRHLPRRA